MDFELGIKQLMANLLRTGFGKYLQSENFRIFMLECGEDESWQRVLSGHRSVFGFDVRSEEKAIMDFIFQFRKLSIGSLESLYGMPNETLYYFLRAMILDFITWSSQIINPQNFESNLRNLDMFPKDIQDFIGNANSINNSKRVVDEKNIEKVSITKEGIFLAGHNFDAMKHVNSLISQAKNSLILIDNFIDDNILNLCSDKPNSFQLKILSKEIKSKLIPLATAFNKQHGNLSIRMSNHFHDRFLITDEKEFYHFGTSLKDVGQKTFMFSKIEEKPVIDLLLKDFKEEWEKSKIII
jgi:hypothetical protein